MPDITHTQSTRALPLSRRQVIQGMAAGAVVASAAGPAVAGRASASPTMRFGTCGHAYNSEAYDSNATDGVSYSEQVSLLTQMGMNIYRSDIANNASGKALNHQKLLNMHSLLDAAGIEMFPHFYTNYSANLSEADNYNLGLIKGEGLATNYGHMFTHCNLGNELETAMKDAPGVFESDYDVPRARRAMQRIRGMNDGMKAVYPGIQTATATAGMFPTWWQHLLLDSGAIDFVDWHWYFEMPGAIQNLPSPLDEITNVLDFLWDEFGVPIWVSETNSRANSNNAPEWDEQQQVNWFNSFYDQCLNHPHCEAMLVYELLNEPKKSSYQEANFGLVKFPPYNPANPDYTWSWKRLGRKLAGLDQTIGHFGSDSEGWALGLGPEFPGAQGSFTRDNGDSVKGTWSAVLAGDFTGGGNYVQISRQLNVDLTELWFWLRTSDLTRVTMRMVDSTGQVHQQRVSITPDDTWQAVHLWSFDSGQDYVHFGGANDGVWHAPASEVALLLSRTSLVSGQLSGSIRFDEVVATVP